ncbi:DUF6314 family protein [Granulicella sp. dw_53]|uniref:DUF6314 family protein n=1 Tax=Granulicella sp. dw_53 TaxID=2719792 RepID=UPI001BD52F90|nr:DUF6314 family protein [Granulicella sp. dw_53]
MLQAEEGWVLERLLGRWAFEREISGHGSMVGFAVFEVDGNRVAYRESGEVKLLDGQRVRGEQKYLYESMQNGFAVYFHDTGLLFHQVGLTAGEDGVWQGNAHHDCKDDVYDSEYVFGRDGTFEVQHQVRGPKKDYVIKTVYRRD